MAKLSRDKGKRGERLWRDVLREHGFNAVRGQQFAGGPDSPDVICEEMSERFHCEVKFAEKLNIREAMRQAEADGQMLIPYVAHKTSRERWLVTMRSNDFLALVRSYLADREPIQTQTN